MMLQLPADVLRMIAEYIPHYQRSLRISSRRLSVIIPKENLPLLNADILQLCKLGHLSVLQLYPISRISQCDQEQDRHKRKTDGLCEIAAKNNHLSLLKWLRQLDIPWGIAITKTATKRKHFELLMWALDNGCPFGWATYYYAAVHDNIPLIRNLLEREQQEGALEKHERPYREGIFRGAAIGGHLHLFQEFSSLISECTDEHTGWLNSAIIRKHDELAKWLFQQGYPVDEMTLSFASERGNIELLDWFRSQGCTWNDQVISGAASRGQLKTLKWLIANGGTLSTETVTVAAYCGQIEVLTWLQPQGWTFDVSTTINAASSQDHECLKWLREQGVHGMSGSVMLPPHGKIFRD